MTYYLQEQPYITIEADEAPQAFEILSIQQQQMQPQQDMILPSQQPFLVARNEGFPIDMQYTSHQQQQYHQLLLQQQQLLSYSIQLQHQQQYNMGLTIPQPQYQGILDARHSFSGGFPVPYNETTQYVTVPIQTETLRSPLSPISDISLPIESLEPEAVGTDSSSSFPLAVQVGYDADFNHHYSLSNSNLLQHLQRKNSAPLPFKVTKRPSIASKRRNSSTKSDHTSQPGPIPASPPEITTDPITGEEMLTFFYSKQKMITKFTIKCPNLEEDVTNFPSEFLNDNCIYPRAMVSEDEYKGNRGNYERECNRLGWQLCWMNPELRSQRGLIQRAVDSWRNTRNDLKLRSRRVRKQAKSERRVLQHESTGMYGDQVAMI